MAIGPIALFAAPLAANTQQPNHSGHSEHGAHAATSAEALTEQAKAVLVAYREALVARDAAAMRALFRDDSTVFENGKAEGSFAQYMEHHLGPELGEITEFTFSDPTVHLRMVGHVAFGYETYRYRIALKDGHVIKRDGVATSVLTYGPQSQVAFSAHRRTPGA